MMSTLPNKNELAELLRYLTPQEIAELDALLSAGPTINPISLTDFKPHIYRRYKHAPHLDALDQHLTQVSRYAETGGKEGIGRLIVEMPPRHGKTLTVSWLYPIWHLGRNPDHRVMLVSYGASLAEKNSRRARNTVAAQVYQALFPMALAGDSKSVQEWDIAGHEGGVSAMGIGGAATGKGAHLLIIDDPIKNREEAESDTMREKVWDAYGDDLYTRLEPGGAVIVMMTRWHQDDLIGRLLRNEPDTWTRLRLPAKAEANDPLGRAPGEALWPWRYPLSVLEDIETKRGPYTWSSLYQQNPVPAEGGIFKRAWFNPVTPPPIVRTVRYWDLAMSERTTADYTAGVKIGEGSDGHFYVLDVFRRRIDWGDLTATMAEVMLADGPECVQGIEEKGYMSRAVQELNADPRLHSYAVFGYPKDKDKVTNALPLAAKFASETLHVTAAHWTDAFTDELCSFPNGAHDDMVDAAAGAWAMIGNAIYDGEMYYAQEANFGTY